MKHHIVRSIHHVLYILEHRVRSGFPDSTVRQCKMTKSTLRKTLHQNTRGKPPELNCRNLLYSSGWIISWLFSQFPCLGVFFSSKIILNTEGKYSYMIDAGTKSKLFFLVR